MLASGSDDKTVMLWDVTTQKPVAAILAAHTRAVNSVAFSPDSTMLASASEDTSIILWDTTTHMPLGPALKGHNGEVQSIAFSPDGKLLASASDDKTVILWDVATHARVGEPFEGHTDVVYAVQFSPDGKMLASGSGDTTAILWDVATHTNLSPTARAVLQLVQDRETRLNAKYQAEPNEEGKPEAPRRLLNWVADRPSMDALAKKWLSRNKHGVRHLEKQTLDEILASGSRAFNLRVADPYRRYQAQGQGFTWSFFTHKDGQNCHVHGDPVVEIYGILEGRLEVWWKPYHDRGTSAWSHRILEPGDWLEVASLQCHIVRWLGEGKGVVFKAGPAPWPKSANSASKAKHPTKTAPT